MDPSGHSLCPTQIDLYRKYREEGLTSAQAFNRMRDELGLPRGNNGESGSNTKRHLVNINDWNGDVNDPSVRLYGTYDELRNAGVKDGHHIVQDAAVRDITGYKKGEAPAIQADGPSTKIGSEHYNLTYDQSHATTGGTYGKEKSIGLNSVEKNLGLSQNDIKSLSNYLDDYFCNNLGLNNDSPTRIPGNRHHISE